MIDDNCLIVRNDEEAKIKRFKVSLPSLSLIQPREESSNDF